MSTKPKKAQTRAKESELERLQWKAVRNFNVASERGDRLDKIVELMKKTLDPEFLEGDGEGLCYVMRKDWRRIYKLAKGTQ